MAKKILAILLALLMVLGAASCGKKTGGEEGPKATDASGESGESNENQGPVSNGTLQVGYARTNITPTDDDGYPLAGYGRTDKRLSNGYLDYTYATCLAFMDAKGTEFLMFSLDIISVAAFVDEFIPMCAEHFGIPEENILLLATHTHSMVDCGQKAFAKVSTYIKTLEGQCIAAAEEALADVKTTKMYWNTVDLTGYNFVRHYFSENGMAVGDNHNSGDFWGAGALVKHTTESNHIMYMVKFEREGAENILLTNWRAHPTITGGSEKQNISADFVGSVRTAFEKEFGDKFVYFQGEAGNQNPRTRLGDNIEYNPPTDFKKYGQEVEEKIAAVYSADNWEEIPTGLITTSHELAEAPANHTRDPLAGVAREIQALWNEEGWTTQVSQMLKDNGLYSPYECGAIISNCGRGKNEKCSLHATLIGDLVLTNEQSEMFDTNGDFVRENSPSKYTIVMSYTDGSGYIPSQFAYDYGCYESDTGRFAPGAGEIFASRLVEMAEELWKNK